MTRIGSEGLLRVSASTIAAGSALLICTRTAQVKSDSAESGLSNEGESRL
jgi:hypothetical protein